MKTQTSTPYIFLDTCSLLDSCWDRADNYVEAKERMFWEREIPSLLTMGEVIIPQRNYEELLKHSKNATNPTLARQAGYILAKLEPYLSDGRIQRAGDANDPFADAILLSVALKFRTTHDMAFITQDTKLAADLNAIQNFRSVRPFNGQVIKIRRVGTNGRLEKHRGLDDEASAGTRENGKCYRAENRSSGETQKPAVKSWWRG